MARPDVTTRVRVVSGTFDRIAFTVWAVALAVGVLLHEWQKGEPAWSFHTVPALLAIAVLLRPSSVLRMIAMLAALAVELVVDLPNPWNHTLILGVVGGAVAISWLLLAARSPLAARDPGHVYRHIAPFLRVAFIVAFFAAAFAKVNSGFLDAVGTCAAWIMESIPLVSVPLDLRPPLIAGTLVLEFTIPVLLIFRRTRPAAIVLGFAFHLLSAVAGHTAFSGFAWSFYLLFLPVGVLARAAVAVRAPIGPELRRQIARAAGSTWTWVALGAGWVLALLLLHTLPWSLLPHARRWGAAVVYLGYALVWAKVLYELRHRWLLRTTVAQETRGALRVGNVVFLAALVLFLVDAASPYVGLKTRYSFTMYSNLQTEPGHWNHLVVPESVRIFDLQDGLVEFTGVSDPDLAAELDYRGGSHAVLAEAQRLTAAFPDAIVRYTLDGQPRVASPVSADPVLGAPVSPFVTLLGGFRPVESDNRCLH